MKKLFKVLFLILSINIFSNFNVSCENDQSGLQLLKALVVHNANTIYQFTKESGQQLKQKFYAKENTELFQNLQNIGFAEFKEEVRQLPQETLLKIQDTASKITWKSSAELMQQSFVKAKNIATENPEIIFSTAFSLIIITALKEQIKTIVCFPVDIAYLPVEIIYFLYILSIRLLIG